jgi:hypothetical protein
VARRCVPSNFTILTVVTGRQGREVGDIVRDSDGSVWLQKRNLNPATAMNRKPAGWAIEDAHLALLQKFGGSGVRLRTIGGDLWVAPISAFAPGVGAAINHHGYGRQTVALLKHWRRNGEPAVPARTGAVAAATQQPRLFGDAA